MIGSFATLKLQDRKTGEYKTLGETVDVMMGKAVDQVFDAAMSELTLTGTVEWRPRASRGWRKHVRRMKMQRR